MFRTYKYRNQFGLNNGFLTCIFLIFSMPLLPIIHWHSVEVKCQCLSTNHYVKHFYVNNNFVTLCVLKNPRHNRLNKKRLFYHLQLVTSTTISTNETLVVAAPEEWSTHSCPLDWKATSVAYTVSAAVDKHCMGFGKHILFNHWPIPWLHILYS